MFVLGFSGEASFQWCIFAFLKQKRMVHGVQELTSIV